MTRISSKSTSEYCRWVPGSRLSSPANKIEHFLNKINVIWGSKTLKQNYVRHPTKITKHKNSVLRIHSASPFFPNFKPPPQRMLSQSVVRKNTNISCAKYRHLRFCHKCHTNNVTVPCIQIESRWGRDFPPVQMGPNQPPVKWVPGLSRG